MVFKNRIRISPDNFLKKDGTMKKINIALIAVFVLILLSSCSTFVKDKEADKLRSFERADDQFIDYRLLKDVETGNLSIKKGEKVRIVISVGGDWIKVYVYRAEEELLVSRRVLALYLFEDDFPDEKYNPAFFREKLHEVVKPLN
jgi:type II secretion system-associated lipoprotein